MWKYGRSDLVKQMNVDDGFDNSQVKTANGNGAATPEQLTDDLEMMGPTYIKLDQVLAGRRLEDAHQPALAGIRRA